MENNNQNNSAAQSAVPLNPVPAASQPPVNSAPMPQVPLPKKPASKLISEVVTRIKANKKLSILLVSFLTIIILIIITGSIYSLVKNSSKSKVVSVSPTPIPIPEIMLSEESKKSRSTLKDLKEKMLNLDIQQKHLTPPNIDFDISF